MSSDESVEEGEILSDEDEGPAPAKKQCRGGEWSSLATEDLLTTGLSGMSKSASNDRGSESYNWRLKKELLNSVKKKDEESSSGSVSSSSDEENEEETMPQLPETFGVIVEKPKKSNVKKRLGVRKNTPSPSEELEDGEKADGSREQEVDMEDGGAAGKVVDASQKPSFKRFPAQGNSRKRKWGRDGPVEPQDPRMLFQHKEMKHVELTDVMEPALIVDTVLDALHEPESNRDLMAGILDALGPERFVKLFKETEDVESMGGLALSNKSRRRTPGGVFFFLVQNDQHLPEERKRELFSTGFQAFKKQCRQYKKARKRFFHEKHGETKKKPSASTDANSKMETETEASLTKDNSTQEASLQQNHSTQEVSLKENKPHQDSSHTAIEADTLEKSDSDSKDRSKDGMEDAIIDDDLGELPAESNLGMEDSVIDDDLGELPADVDIQIQ